MIMVLAVGVLASTCVILSCGCRQRVKTGIFFILLVNAINLYVITQLLKMREVSVRADISTRSTIPTPGTAREGIYNLMYPYYDGQEWIGIVQRNTVDLIDAKKRSFQSHPVATVDLLKLTGYTPDTNILTETIYVEVIHGKDPRVQLYDPFKHSRDEEDGKEK